MLTPVHNKTLGKLEIWRKFSIDKEHLSKPISIVILDSETSEVLHKIQ